jgi:Tol biopolymer transport system component
MALNPGTRFGPYEIQTALGAGGMGEVYRARDTRLGRDVAVKVLPEHQADGVRRERFQREARAVAALSHPNICTIHDVGHEAGVDFLVMEFIDGESLATRLARGPLPLAQALNLAIEIAEGLSSAHRQGIVHRDLKPGNVMLTRAGSGRPHATHAKVLDFGLASLLTDEGDGSERTALPTAAAPLTETGSMLGTLQYMAPEQIEGRRVDARTDIFAFGALLFEMLTGRRAFEAPSSPRLMAAILEGDSPTLATHQPSVPPSLDWIVRTCLEKDPEDRFGSMHDVLLQLRRVSTSETDGAVDTAVRPQTSKMPTWVRPLMLATAALALTAAGFWWGRGSENRGNLNQLMFNVLPPEGAELGPGISVSPDGQSLAAIALGTRGSPSLLWIRHLRSSAAMLLRGTEGATYPFWSPDGRSIAFFAQAKLKRVDLNGGTPVVVADVQSGRGGVWFEDGTIVVAALNTPGLLRLPASGGAASPFVSIKEGSGFTCRFPVRVGSRRFVYLALADDEAKSELRLSSLDDPQSSVMVVRSRRSAAYVNGFLLYDRDGVIVSQPFDSETGSLSGEPKPLIELPGAGIGSGNIGYSPITSGNRTIAWYARLQPTGQLTWLGRDGVARGTLGAPDSYTSFALSPDEKRIAVSDVSRLLIMDTQSGTRQEVANGRNLTTPRWSPDGTRVAFQSSRGPSGSINIYGVAIAQQNKIEPLAEAPLMLQVGGWTPRGTFLWLQSRSQTVTEPQPGAAWFNDRGVLVRGPDGPPRLLTADADVAPLAVSRDGAFIAYPRQLGAQWEICMDHVETPKGCQPLGFTSAARPAAFIWRADGREFIFRSGDDVISVPVQPGVLPVGARPVRLFQARGTSGLAVTSSGDRFLVLEARTTPPPTLSVAVNWSPDSSR